MYDIGVYSGIGSILSNVLKGLQNTKVLAE